MYAAAKAHVSALDRMMEEKPEIAGSIEYFNLSTVGISVLQMLELFKKATGIAVPYRIVDRRPGDVERVWADPSRASPQLQRSLPSVCRAQPGRPKAWPNKMIKLVVPFPAGGPPATRPRASSVSLYPQAPGPSGGGGKPRINLNNYRINIF